MSVTCLVSHTANDLRCPVCGQGFLLFTGGRVSATAREQVRHRVRLAVRQHHAVSTSGMEVHPRIAFAVEEENHAFTHQMGRLAFDELLTASVC